MFGTKKLKVLIWSVTISLLFIACSQKELANYTITGNTQGTTYSIIIVDDKQSVSKASIDSLFNAFDLVLSTYIEESIISKLNAADSSIRIEDPSGNFKRCYQSALHIFETTNGAFDPSVFPLVEGWGFMKNMQTPLDSVAVDSLMQFVDFTPGKLHDITFSGHSVHLNKKPGFKIDFNAIAQGLSVDLVDEFLRDRGLKNYYIEIGGEIVVKGTNRQGEKWRIGIDTPIEDQSNRTLDNVLVLSDKAIATSGNYRKFYEVNGAKYAHTLNPKSGWPVQHSLLSATVIADNCTVADAYATAFMVLGVDKTLELIKKEKLLLQVYLIYNDAKGNLAHSYSPGLEKYLE